MWWIITCSSLTNQPWWCGESSHAVHLQINHGGVVSHRMQFHMQFILILTNSPLYIQVRIATHFDVEWTDSTILTTLASCTREVNNAIVGLVVDKHHIKVNKIVKPRSCLIIAPQDVKYRTDIRIIQCNFSFAWIFWGSHTIAYVIPLQSLS